MYDWICDFLSDSTFQVCVGTFYSDRLVLENGTPQGILEIEQILMKFLEICGGLTSGSE